VRKRQGVAHHERRKELGRLQFEQMAAAHCGPAGPGRDHQRAGEVRVRVAQASQPLEDEHVPGPRGRAVQEGAVDEHHLRGRLQLRNRQCQGNEGLLQHGLPQDSQTQGTTPPPRVDQPTRINLKKHGPHHKQSQGFNYQTQ